MGPGGGANLSLHPPFRRKEGAPVPMHPLATGLNERTNKRMNEQINEQTKKQTNELINKQKTDLTNTANKQSNKQTKH